MKYNSIPHQLIFAREYRGISQTELAAKISGLSQSNLSKYEKGIGFVSRDILLKVFEFLNFPENFFNKNINNLSDTAHFRKRTTITKKQRIEIESHYRLIGYLIDQMSESLDWPSFKLRTFDLEDDFTPEYAALMTRKYLGLRMNEPVKNICQLLEQNGILIVEIDAAMKFDGVSFTTDKIGYPVIVINRNFPNDRKRFTIAHELGHLLMHSIDSPAIPKYREEKIKEDEANKFASEFLFPKHEAIRVLSGLRLSDLAQLKRYWLISMAAIIRKAYDLGFINYEKYRYFNIELSRGKQKRNEDIYVDIDRPTLFQKGYKIFTSHLDYLEHELSKAWGLPVDIIRKLFNREKIRVL